MNEELEALIVQNQNSNREVNDNLEALIVQTQKNDNKDELEAIAKANIDTKNVIKKGNKEIVNTLKELKPEIIQGKTAGDLITTILQLITGKDGYTPEKGKDYFTEDEIKKFKEEVTPKKGEDYVDGKDGDDGYTPIKGKDYFTQDEINNIINRIIKEIPKPKDGKDGEDGKDAEIDYEKVLKLVIKKLPKIEKPKEKTIDEFIEDLKGKISFNDLKDLPLTLRQAARDYDFLELTDTPKSYKGESLKLARVKEDETGIEFVAPQTIEDVNWGEINGTLSDQTDLQGVLDDKLNLDQTIPQTTVGTFTFPIIKANSAEITGSLTANNLWYLDGNTLGSKKLLGSIDNQDFGIITNNTERLTVLKNGNVGIGTTNPGHQLEVIGTMYTGTHAGYGDTSYRWSQYSGNSSTITGGIKMRNGGGAINTGINIRQTVCSGGNTDLVTVLTDTNNTSDFYISTTNVGVTTEKFRITGGGNVGIGTTNPLARLNVFGTTKLGMSPNATTHTLDIGGNINFDYLDNPSNAQLNGIVLTPSAGGNLKAGTYYYDIVFVTADGETGSNQSASVPSVVTALNDKVTITNIPTSPNERVTGRKIYRSIVNGNRYDTYYLTTINDNTTTSYVDTLADSSLGSEYLYRKANTTAGQIFAGASKILQASPFISAFGLGALQNNTSGNSSTAIGPGALRDNTTGANNNATGYASLVSNTTGSGNNGYGYATLYTNRTGSNNSAFGDNALRNNTTGSNNSAIGMYALYGNTTGYQNSAIGMYALYGNTTGYQNSAIGVYALRDNTTGYSNSAIGASAGRYLSDGTTGRETGNNGLYLGYGSKASANGTNNEIVIGYDAIGKGSNTAVIGNNNLTALYVSGQIVPAKLSSEPTGIEGGIYYNTTDKHFYGYNGTTYVQLDN